MFCQAAASREARRKTVLMFAEQTSAFVLSDAVARNDNDCVLDGTEKKITDTCFLSGK